MRIVLIGADGQLGTDLLPALAGEDVRPLLYPAFDVTRAEEARRTILDLGPEAVINTAAFHRVDECEDNPLEAFRVNAFAVRDLARACREAGAVLVHFSTDYVFDGERRRPYTEDDCPRPLSAYAASKLAGEHFLRAEAERFLLIRTCGLYGLAGSREKGTNFVESMLRLRAAGRAIRVVDDQVVTPTSTTELAGRVAELVRAERLGLFHLTNEGSCTWFEFARAIFELAGLEANVRPVDTASFGAKARRPAYSVLENARLKALGLAPFRPWRDALGDYLEARRARAAAG